MSLFTTLLYTPHSLHIYLKAEESCCALEQQYHYVGLNKTKSSASLFVHGLSCCHNDSQASTTSKTMCTSTLQTRGFVIFNDSSGTRSIRLQPLRSIFVMVGLLANNTCNAVSVTSILLLRFILSRLGNCREIFSTSTSVTLTPLKSKNSKFSKGKPWNNNIQ